MRLNFVPDKVLRSRYPTFRDIAENARTNKFVPLIKEICWEDCLLVDMGGYVTIPDGGPKFYTTELKCFECGLMWKANDRNGQVTVTPVRKSNV
jgi:hypothetical protein